jgi:hypothetical protein
MGEAKPTENVFVKKMAERSMPDVVKQPCQPQQFFHVESRGNVRRKDTL